MLFSTKRPQLRAALFFLGIAIVIGACERPEEEIGLDLQPDEDILSVHAVDTFTVRAYTIEEDSIRSDKLTPALFGAYNDPVFGYTRAGHVTELRLSSSNPNFLDGASIDDIVIDSLVLALDFDVLTERDLSLTYVYGGLGSQYVEVFEVLDSLSVDSIYYDNRRPRTSGEDLVLDGRNRLRPNPIDSIIVGGSKVPAEMRIPLKPELADRFLQANAEDGVLSADRFVELLHGLYITVDPFAPFVDLNGTGIIYFDTFRQTSRMIMYYRNNATLDTLAYNFEIRSNTGKYATFEHDYTFADMNLRDQIGENGNRELGKQDLYIQAMGGTKLRVELPFIENLKDSTNFALNKVELICPVRDENLEDFPPPPILFIFGLDEDDRIFILPDQLDNLIGGTYNEDDKEYRFIITSFVQQILNGTRENYGLEIVSNRAAFSGNRVVLNGPQYPDPAEPSNNLKLAITFTKF